MQIRHATSGDRAPLRALMRRVQVFEPHEIHVAEELIEERLAGSTDYLIYVADEEAEVDRGGTPLLGFVCHGHNPVTDAVHDIYWIVVDPCAQRHGRPRDHNRNIQPAAVSRCTGLV